MREMTKGMENVYPGEDKAGDGGNGRMLPKGAKSQLCTVNNYSMCSVNGYS